MWRTCSALLSGFFAREKYFIIQVDGSVQARASTPFGVFSPNDELDLKRTFSMWIRGCKKQVNSLKVTNAESESWKRRALVVFFLWTPAVSARFHDPCAGFYLSSLFETTDWRGCSLFIVLRDCNDSGHRIHWQTSCCFSSLEKMKMGDGVWSLFLRERVCDPRLLRVCEPPAANPETTDQLFNQRRLPPKPLSLPFQQVL